jgi:hypothetical protein
MDWRRREVIVVRRRRVRLMQTPIAVALIAVAYYAARGLTPDQPAWLAASVAVCIWLVVLAMAQFDVTFARRQIRKTQQPGHQSGRSIRP